MMQKNRRPRVERRERMFITTLFSFTLVAGNIGTASQQSDNQCTADLNSRIGATSRQGYTASRIWVRGYWHTLAAVTTPVIANYTLAMGFFPFTTDNGDFLDIAAHQGNLLLHDVRVLSELSAANTNPIPLQPDEGRGSSTLDLANRSARKVPRADWDLFTVVQQDTATEENIQLRLETTVMWLLP